MVGWSSDDSTSAAPDPGPGPGDLLWCAVQREALQGDLGTVGRDGQVDDAHAPAPESPHNPVLHVAHPTGTGPRPWRAWCGPGWGIG